MASHLAPNGNGVVANGAVVETPGQVLAEDLLHDIDPHVPLEYLNKARELSGKPAPEHVPRETLVETHNHHVNARRQTPATKRTNLVKRPILTLAYPASFKPLSELKPILLKDLLLEHRHDGTYLLLRTITQPYQGAGTVVIAEDETNDAHKVSFYNQGDSTMVALPPEGSIIAIKEPYFKYNAPDDFMVCVDHPSDAVYLKFDDPIIPKAFQSDDEETDTAADWKSAGDTSFIAKNLPIAVYCYSKALEVDTSEDKAFRSDLHAKKAGAHLAIKCYDQAIQDAMASLRDTVATDTKAYVTAGRAAYELRKYKASREYYEKALALNPDNAIAKRELGRCFARMKEEQDGTYNFEALARTLTKDHIHMDCASFLRNTYVAESPFHGRGLFAARDIKAGEMIFCEKATCLPNEFNLDHNAAALYANLVRICNNNPSVHAEIRQLYGGTYQRTGEEGSVVDGSPVTDVFLLESIRRKNCFSGPRASAGMWTSNWSMRRDGLSRGLWLHSSYVNHSCVPNSNRSFVGDMLISTATADIPKDSEITHIYFAPRAIFSRRKEQFSNWGFTCTCRLCAAEARSPDENHEKRRAVLGEIETIVRKKKPTVFQSNAVVRSVEKLAKQLESLHEEEIYGSIPRVPLVWPSMWLLQAYHTRGNHSKVAKWALVALRNFGFVEPMRDGEVLVYKSTETAMTTFEVVKALKFAGDAYEALGDGSLATQFRDAARVGYKSLTGFDTNFDALLTNSQVWE